MDISRWKDYEPIDHVLVSRQHRTSVMDTRAMRGADIASDHQFIVRTKVRLKLKRKQQSKATRKKIDITKLQKPSIKTKFTIELRNRFDALQDYDDKERVPLLLQFSRSIWVVL